MTTTGVLERPDGVRLAFEHTLPQGVEDSGGDGPVIVLTHGFTVTLRMWDPTVTALIAAGWRVVTWDLRGHGATVTPEDPACYTLDAVVEDLVALLDHLGVERAVLGGLSFGGYLSLAAWCRQPDRVSALVLADCGPGYRRPEPRQAWNDMVEARATAIEAAGLDVLRGDPAAGSSEAVRAQVGLDRHRSVDELVLAVRGFLAQHDGLVMERLAQVDVPTLVVVGANDEPFLNGSEVMAAKIPGAQLVVITDAGHVANLDQPEAFNRAVVGFLSQLSS
jgi:pimeloyl-ACP methyl ester carboxylesterase